MKGWLGLTACVLPLIADADLVVPIESVEEYVNIRMIPDEKSEIVGRLYRGDSARLVKTRSDWYEIEIAGGATGFISADWTNVVEEMKSPGAATERAMAGVAETDARAITSESKDVDSNPAGNRTASPLMQAGKDQGNSAREDRSNVVELTSEQALAALAHLEPVIFSNKQDGRERHAGFVTAEEPDLVGGSGTQGMSTMDIVAVLTRVVQLQQRKLMELESRLEDHNQN